MEETRSKLWSTILSRVKAEYSRLPAMEKEWIAARLERIETLQQELNDLFETGNGLDVCQQCQGDCCAKGHNHMTLVNLLGFARWGILPPEADFSRTCPFLGSQGCLLPVKSRPYNCVTFICDNIEYALSEEERNRFYSLDNRLRELYQEFSDRYVGAAMTGLLIREQRCPGQHFLTLI